MYSAIRSAALARLLARSFSTSQPKLDVARVTLVGRLGADPVLKTTATDKPYYTYAVATNGPAIKGPDGKYTDGHTSWHTVFSFNEGQHPTLARLGKGSVVYVEADLEMRRTDSQEGERGPDRAFLRQLSLKPITRAKPESEDEASLE
ncbi:hypothetical protein DB88DRAFT_507950 [Papiliotrema laurentii]|uniref:Nucleic acid-binding protein n=1 Tax=Papiliotrema laurentii TaxID=5418 RepID=A0AAD9L991_PAPLA|nr:hypothetical protein DB88DRAFT_507950 [Papiliotrema laurentii]